MRPVRERLFDADPLPDERERRVTPSPGSTAQKSVGAFPLFPDGVALGGAGDCGDAPTPGDCSDDGAESPPPVRKIDNATLPSTARPRVVAGSFKPRDLTPMDPSAAAQALRAGPVAAPVRRKRPLPVSEQGARGSTRSAKPRAKKHARVFGPFDLVDQSLQLSALAGTSDDPLSLAMARLQEEDRQLKQQLAKSEMIAGLYSREVDVLTSKDDNPPCGEHDPSLYLKPQKPFPTPVWPFILTNLHGTRPPTTPLSSLDRSICQVLLPRDPTAASIPCCSNNWRNFQRRGLEHVPFIRSSHQTS
jgi:hypothetical protein